MKSSSVLLMCIVLIVGSYAIWNYSEVRSTVESIQKEWRVRNWDQRIKDKIAELDRKVETQEESVIAIKVKNRDVLRKLDNEEDEYNKYDEVIRGLVEAMNQVKDNPNETTFVYCGKTYETASAQEEFDRWTSELLPIKKRIDFLNKQKELYDKSIDSINNSIHKMQANIQNLEHRALELATIRDTLKAQELEKELVVDVAGIDDSGVKELMQEMQQYVDEIDIRLNSEPEIPSSSGLDAAVKFKENIKSDSDLDQLREQYLNVSN